MALTNATSDNTTNAARRLVAGERVGGDATFETTITWSGGTGRPPAPPVAFPFWPASSGDDCEMADGCEGWHGAVARLVSRLLPIH